MSHHSDSSIVSSPLQNEEQQSFCALYSVPQEVAPTFCFSNTSFEPLHSKFHLVEF